MSIKYTTLRPIALALATALCASPVFAQSSSDEPVSILQDFGSAERIQRAGSLRMLSQRISATACNHVAGIDVDDASKYLARSLRDYRRILAGLENGDDGLGLYGPETDRAVLRDVSALNVIWAPLDETFNTVATDALDIDDVTEIAATVPDMLETSKALLAFVVAEYSDPAQMLQSDAVLLQIAERQRMLEQVIANASCLIGEGIQTEASRAVLEEAVPLYEVSLDALRNGLPEAGVAPPPTAAISLWLADISDRWTDVRPTIERVAATGEISTQERQLIFAEMNKLTWMMNVTVGQYTEASKLQFNLSR